MRQGVRKAISRTTQAPAAHVAHPLACSERSPDELGRTRGFLHACLARHAGASAEDLVQAVVSEVVEFAAGAPPADDTTVLAITWAAHGSAAIV